MTELLFQTDSYLKEFQAGVTEALEDGAVLDQTAFYAGGGGQPYDTGSLTVGDVVYNVSKVGRSGGKVVHQVEGWVPEHPICAPKALVPVPSPR